MVGEFLIGRVYGYVFPVGEEVDLFVAAFDRLGVQDFRDEADELCGVFFELYVVRVGAVPFQHGEFFPVAGAMLVFTEALGYLEDLLGALGQKRLHVDFRGGDEEA